MQPQNSKFNWNFILGLKDIFYVITEMLQDVINFKKYQKNSKNKFKFNKFK